MKSEYKNKMMTEEKTKLIPRYIGDVELYWPDFGKITKPGDYLEELPIEQAKARKDFILTERSA